MVLVAKGIVFHNQVVVEFAFQYNLAVFIGCLLTSFTKYSSMPTWLFPPWGRRGFKPRIRPPYPQHVVKGD